MEKLQKVSTEGRETRRRVIEPAQLRAARALLNWSQGMLAEKAGVASLTVKRAELESAIVSPKTQDAMRAVLEAAGIIFIAENGEGPGVRLKKHRT